MTNTLKVSAAVMPMSAANMAAQTTPRHRWMLPLLLIGQAMAAMDTAIVNVAAPALHSDLGISGALLQMVVAGYVLAYAVFLVTGARLGDDYGYRKLFVSGVTVFTLSSLVCGLAPSTLSLIVARVVQGMGAALMVPQVLSLIQRHFEGPEKARAIGYYSMILGLGATLGQLLGGVIITVDVMDLSWRPAFLINVPIGVVLLLFSHSVLPDTRGLVKRKLDIVGVIALSLSMLLVIVPLTFGREVNWHIWTWYSMGGGVLGLIAFVLYEQALARRGGSPLLDFGTILTPGIRAGLLAVSIGFIGYGGWLFALALYLQDGLGFSAMISGLVFTAYAIGFGVANLNWSKLPPSLLKWTPTVALSVMVVANIGFCLSTRHWGWNPWVMLPLLLSAGSSHGLSFGTLVNQMSTRVQPVQAPALSGLVTTSVQLSIVIGIATLGTLYFATVKLTSSLSASTGMSSVTFAIATMAVLAVGCSVWLTKAPRVGVQH